MITEAQIRAKLEKEEARIATLENEARQLWNANQCRVSIETTEIAERLKTRVKYVKEFLDL